MHEGMEHNEAFLFAAACARSNHQLPSHNSQHLARHENHNYQQIKLLASLDEIRVQVSDEVAWYFVFCKFTIVLNTLIGIPGLVLTLLHISTSTEPLSINHSFYIDITPIFYVANFDHQTLFIPWVITTSLTAVAVLTSVFVYCKYIARIKESKTLSPFQGHYALSTQQHQSVDVIFYEQDPTPAAVAVGRFLSALIFFLALGINVTANLMVYKYLEQNGDTLISVVSAVILAASNFVWSLVCDQITTLEKHRFYSHLFISQFVKNFLFHVISTIVLLCSNDLLLIDSNPRGPCALNLLSHQFFILMVYELLFNVAEIYGPKIQKWLINRNIYILGKERSSLQSMNPVFNCPTEYIELIYRQFLISAGMTVVPMMPIFGAMVNLCEYWVDKYKLLRVMSSQSTPTNNTYLPQVAGSWTLLLVVAVVMYPAGITFVLWQAREFYNTSCLIYYT